MNPQQWFDTQSESFEHFFWLAHFGQFAPPQSVSDSPWFFTLSEQLTHLPLSQNVLVHSAPLVQLFPSAQSPQSSVVPHPSVGWPHCVPHAVGVQHALL